MPYKSKEKRYELAAYRRLRTRYGLSKEQYSNFLVIQNYVCAICQNPEVPSYKKRLSVDHDHNTGQVRGLLCHACNTALGKFKDSLELLESAVQYLKRQEEA